MASNNVEKRIDYIRKDNAIIDATAELLLKKSIEKISINEIASLANVNRGTFYLHYEDKYQVLEALEKRLLNELKEMNRDLSTLSLKHADPNQPFPYFVETYKWIGENRMYLNALLGPNGDLGFILQLKKIVNDYFHTLLKRNGLFFTRPEIVMHAVNSIVIEFIRFYLEKIDDVTPEEMSIVCGRCIYGVLTQFQ